MPLNVKRVLEQTTGTRRAQPSTTDQHRAHHLPGWKPRHYVPATASFLSLGEDVIDLVKKWVGREKSSVERFLLGAKMSDLALKDYLDCTGNL